MQDDDPAEILSSSLHSLYGLVPITSSSAGSQFCYKSGAIQLTVQTPDTAAANWSLHANSIWAASLFLVDHLDEILNIPPNGYHRILELGAGAGLPGIFLAKRHQHLVEVVVSDYPDETLIRTLTANVARNSVPNCSAVPYAWGTPPGSVFGGELFDTIIAADTLWNPELHKPFIQSLSCLLKKEGRINLLAGLHTGRPTIAAFLTAASAAGFKVVFATERESIGTESRPWSSEYSEDESERRRWIVWIGLELI
ncbi:hypothetical protein C8J56DRAFT_799760 [Mycena floridula]|nr:hypothetical protein C8J56DRAFT_799760 [Mycena floridula]